MSQSKPIQGLRDATVATSTSNRSENIEHLKIARKIELIFVVKCMSFNIIVRAVAYPYQLLEAGHSSHSPMAGETWAV